MPEWSIAIIVALITGILSLIGTVFAAKRQHDITVLEVKKQMEIQDVKLEAMVARYQAVTDVKLDELTREVRNHNGFAERIPKMETQIEAINRRLQTLEQRAS